MGAGTPSKDFKFIIDAGYSGPMGLRGWKSSNTLDCIYLEKRLPVIVKLMACDEVK